MTDKNDNPKSLFSFCIKHDGKIYDIYEEAGIYDKNDDFIFHPWWPIVGEEGDENRERNGATYFIPPGFSEAVENCYEYRGTFEEAIEQLKRCGFSDIQRSPTDWN